LLTKAFILSSHGKNDFAEAFKNLARFENNFIGSSKLWWRMFKLVVGMSKLIAHCMLEFYVIILINQ